MGIRGRRYESREERMGAMDVKGRKGTEEEESGENRRKKRKEREKESRGGGMSGEKVRWRQVNIKKEERMERGRSRICEKEFGEDGKGRKEGRT